MLIVSSKSCVESDNESDIIVCVFYYFRLKPTQVHLITNWKEIQSLRKMSKLCQAIIYESDANRLTILNQLLLPVQVEYEDILTVNDGWQAIKQMKVRGAPAIAHIALMSLVTEISHEGFADSIDSDPARFLEYLIEKVYF